MATTAFQASEQRLNNAVRARLCNAVAVIAGGPEVGVIFDNGFAVGGVGVIGMATSQPSIELPTQDLPSQPHGASVVIGATTWRIDEHQPDGSGWSRVELSKP